MTAPITRISNRPDDEGFGPQLQNHGQIDDVHGLFVNEARSLGGLRHQAFCGPVKQAPQLFGFRAGAVRHQMGQALNGLALQKMLSDGCYQRGLTTCCDG